MLHCFRCYRRLKSLGLWIFFSFVFIQSSSARNISNRPAEPPFVRLEKCCIPADTTRRFDPFLVLALTDTSKRKVQERKSKQFYQKLKEKFYRTRLTRELFDLLFVAPSKEPALPQPPAPLKAKYDEHQGKLIGEIEIKKLDLFGPTVMDTTRKPHSWLQKTLNNLHIPTRNSVLKKNLLIKPGDSIDPNEIADNERVLRELSFIRDVRIYVVPRSENSDSVDILVLVQDVFPYSVGGSYRGLDRFSFELRNNNLIGLGHEFSSKFLYDNRQPREVGYRGLYYIPNISGSFINSQLEYINTDWEKTQGVIFQREFYTPEVRWAGGLQQYRTTLRHNLLNQERELDSIYNYRNNYTDLWGAYAFRLWKSSSKTNAQGRSRIVLAGRFSRTDFRMRPSVTPTTQHFFHDNRLYIASIGWSRRQYYTDRYLFGFGRTEDVPYGSLVNFIFGHENREFDDYHYAGLSMARGRYYWRFGYFMGLAELGSFFQNNWKMSRRQLHLRANYYSPLLEAGAYSFRHTLSIDYLYGDRRFEHEFLWIGEENIRGFNTWEQRGTQRFSFRFESICFTPLYLLGFQFAGYVFGDLSFLNSHTGFSMKGEDFHGYGLGFRIRNENLTFKTFQVRFTVYPSIPEKSFGISISTIPRQLFQDFLIGKPQPLLYR